MKRIMGKGEDIGIEAMLEDVHIQGAGGPGDEFEAGAEEGEEGDDQDEEEGDQLFRGLFEGGVPGVETGEPGEEQGEKGAGGVADRGGEFGSGHGNTPWLRMEVL